MELRCIHVAIVAATVVTVAPSVDAALKSTGIQRYDDAVAKAVSYLQTRAAPDEEKSSLVSYALLKAGVDVSDPRLADGLQQAQQRALAARYDPYHGLYLAAVDAMLMADVDAQLYQREIQSITGVLEQYQEDNGGWRNPAFGPDGPNDTSLTQYCVLGLWAARRAGCSVSPTSFDKAADYLAGNARPDGGWSYLSGRVPNDMAHHTESTVNMTLAAMGTVGVAKLLLFPERKPKPQGRFGGVLQTTPDPPKKTSAYRKYRASTTAGTLDSRIDAGRQWFDTRSSAVPSGNHKLYFYYTLERAAALVGLEEDWYTKYGDGLLTLQGTDGQFSSNNGADVGTSFAILYFMRSTQQILDYGKGVQTGSRDLVEFINPRRKDRRPIGPLDALLDAMQGQDFSDLDVNTDEVVQKIQFSSREDLIGEADKLKILIKNPDPANRQIAYWALSRTGDFDLIPLMLDGLTDPAVNVNVEALSGLRYISRQPKGLGISLDPLAQAPPGADDTARRNAANVWREKALRVWRGWYSKVRPYEQRDGLDEIGLPLD